MQGSTGKFSVKYPGAMCATQLLKEPARDRISFWNLDILAHADCAKEVKTTTISACMHEPIS